MIQSEDAEHGDKSSNHRSDGVFEETRRHPVNDVLEQILTDRGLLTAGEDAIEKTKVIAGALDDLAGFLGIHQPYAL
jgi:hypothetical protein